MINFTENSTAEDIIDELNKYIPYLDENCQFINKYRKDFVYHFNKNFYNLALFSFHYLYMFIINTSMVKYFSFNKNEIINKTTGNNKDLNIQLFSYFSKKGEVKTIKLIDNVLTKRTKSIHEENVKLRNKIAHSSGIAIIREEFVKYLSNCFYVLDKIHPIILCKYFEYPSTNKIWNNINQDCLNAIWEKDEIALEEQIFDFLKNFYLSYNDIIYIDNITKELNAIKFLRQFIFLDESGNYYFDYNKELDLHQSLYDTFTSKYEPAFSSKNEDILDSVDILNILKDLDETTNKYIAYNVFDKLMEASQYWVPFGSQKMKEKQLF